MNFNPGLPVGAATSANQTNGQQKTELVNSDGITAINPAREDGNLQTLNTTVSQTSFDPVSNNMTFIQHSHDEIHSGLRFMASTAGTISANSSVTFLFVPDGKISHMVHKVSVDQGVNSVVYEGPTVTSNGTSIAIFNRKRPSTNTSAALVYVSPTTTSTGTQIHIELIGSSKSSGQNRASDEINYSIGKNYLVALNNISNQVSNYSMEFDWYETTI